MKKTSYQHAAVGVLFGSNTNTQELKVVDDHVFIENGVFWALLKVQEPGTHSTKEANGKSLLPHFHFWRSKNQLFFLSERCPKPY